MLKSIIVKSGKFKNALDFLDYTDDMIFCFDSDDTYVTQQLGKIRNRILPKRAFCFSSRTMENVSVQKEIMSGLENTEFRDDIISNIVIYIKDNMGHEISEDEIWIDAPKNPKFKEATQCLIKSEGSNENNYIFLRDVFPTDDWVRAYSENKWKGFVYAMPENCKDVAKASKYVFEGIFETKFNLFATKLCKIEDEE
jgi:hypothetical protein